MHYICIIYIEIGWTIVVRAYPSFFFFISEPLTHNRRRRAVSPSSNINATHTYTYITWILYYIRIRGRRVCAINWPLSNVRGVMFTAARFRKIKTQIFCIERVRAQFFSLLRRRFQVKGAFLSHMFHPNSTLL